MPGVIDCIPFFNELDLLEVRLNELSDVVDTFVISEATRTFQNKRKPLYFHLNRDRYKEFLDRIHYVRVDSYDGIDMNNAWSMDHGQKQRGLDEAMTLNPDILIVTDCDEVPSAEVVGRFQETSWPIASLEMDLFYYWINCLCTSLKWRFPAIVRPGSRRLRFTRARGKHHKEKLDSSGWHFSYIGNVIEKLQAFAHTEFAGPPYTDESYIEGKKKAKLDLFGRDHKYKFKILEDLRYLPQYILANRNRFEKWICPS